MDEKVKYRCTINLHRLHGIMDSDAAFALIQNNLADEKYVAATTDFIVDPVTYESIPRKLIVLLSQPADATFLQMKFYPNVVIQELT